jgi:membrane protein YdbS with pleckstrin-like domain
VPISQRLLNEEEEVLVDLHPHWRFVAAPAFLTVAAAAVAVTLVSEFPQAPNFVSWILLGMVAVPALWLLARLTRWAASSFVVTNQRLIVRQGVFRRQMVQLRLSRVKEIHSAQSLLERLFRTGRIVVEVSDEPAPFVVDDVRHPRFVQQVVNEQLEEPAAPVAPAAPPFPIAPTGPTAAGDPDRTPPHGVPVVATVPAPVALATGPPIATGGPAIPDQLIALDDLRQRGIVTEAEFQQKKHELLSRL